MTAEEKMDLIRGGVEPAATYQGQAGYLPGVPHLGVPLLRLADGPPGVLTRIPGQAQTATMGVAATWSVKDAEQNGVAIGREARSLGIDVVLQPFINIDRDLTFARSYNTLGEGPLLNGAMGAAEIRGEQAQGVMSQAKRYVGYYSDCFGERSPGVPERQVGPFAAMNRLAPNAKITFAVADDMTGTTIDAAMFTHDGKPGLLRTDAAGQTSTDATIDFTKTNGKPLPANTAATWKGELTVPSDGAYWLYLQALAPAPPSPSTAKT